MREVLFRGKTNFEGRESQWVYGSLLAESPNTFPIIAQDYDNDEEWIGIIEWATVDPETVGQYTGSTDKNGKKIFEGDVVDFYFFDKGHKNTKTMLIGWRDNGFGMRELYRDYRLADDFSIIAEKIFTYRGDIRNGVYKSNNTYFVEVVGNIHDNPKFLEVKDDER